MPRFKTSTGVDIKVVTDDTAESAYEILVGNSKRAGSTAHGTAADAQNNYYGDSWVAVDGNTLVINATLAVNVKEAVSKFANSYLS